MRGGTPAIFSREMVASGDLVPAVVDVDVARKPNDGTESIVPGAGGWPERRPFHCGRAAHAQIALRLGEPPKAVQHENLRFQVEARRLSASHVSIDASDQRVLI